MKNICVITTGGTFSCVENSGVLSPLAVVDFSALYSGKNAVKFHVFSPFSLLSENMSASDLRGIKDAILTLDNTLYDGIILTHGTDTLAYTSCYLSCMLQDFQTPIVMVSANYPLRNKNSNGGANFSFGVDFLCGLETFGVFVCYQNPRENPKVHHGHKLLQCVGMAGYFCSEDNQICGEFVDNKFEYCGKLPLFSLDISKNPNGEIKNRVLAIPAVSCCDFSLYNLENCNADIILVQTFHSGTAKTAGENSILQLFAHAKSANIPVVLAPKSTGTYESMEELRKNAEITRISATFEMAYVRCMLGFLQD